MSKTDRRAKTRKATYRWQAVPRGRSATIDRIIALLSEERGRIPSDAEIASTLAISINGVARLRASHCGCAR
jgi:hypothetical protein